MASGLLIEKFFPASRDLVSTNMATPDTRNLHNVLDFDDTVDKSAVFTGFMPADYGSGGLTLKIGFSHAATTGNVQWQAAIERIGTAQSVDSDSFAAANTVDDVAVGGTAGYVAVATITFTDGADMDSLAASELFRLKLTKVDATTSAAAGDTEFHFCVVTET